MTIPSPQVNPTGEPVPPEVGQVSELSAAIAGITTLVILTLGWLAWRRIAVWAETWGADLRATKNQTTNGHKTNLRDDVTCIQGKVDDLVRAVAESNRTLDSVVEAQRVAHDDVRELRKDFRFALEYVRDVDKRVTDDRADT